MRRKAEFGLICRGICCKEQMLAHSWHSVEICLALAREENISSGKVSKTEQFLRLPKWLCKQSLYKRDVSFCIKYQF